MLTTNERIALFKSIPNGIYRPATVTYMEIMDVIQHHVSFETKTARGIEYFEMKPHPVYDNRGIYIVHPDGTETDISFRKGYPIRGGGRSGVKATRSKVFRMAVLEQTNAYKVKNCTGDCARCGDRFEYDELQVDHCGTKFRDIMAEFIRNFGEPHAFDDNGDMGRNFSTLDDDYCEKWKTFHASKATYRMLCKTCNRATSVSDSA
ncbi:hypothetical protein JKP88DRAFT_242186 [Tribonema minus]|uniref:Uncharacterized protein n=1 Tax=Tribonema minus TaxID=303371 RepID=A0A835YL50_9STRA|nr:hypothetical protein JKP88DRAFT_242186 [Tribonema minus]